MLGSPVSEVVSKYCQLDYEGARTPAGKYGEIRNLMAWGTDQDEPGWDCFKIISRYRILNEKINGAAATVTVEYTIIASVWSSARIDKNSYINTVDVELLETPSGWKIRKYVVYPRISINTAIALFDIWIKEWQAGGLENDEKVFKIKSFKNELEKLR